MSGAQHKAHSLGALLKAGAHPVGAAWARYWSEASARWALALCALYLLLGIFVLVGTPWAVASGQAARPPSSAISPLGLHLLGTDAAGRDLLLRGTVAAGRSLVVVTVLCLGTLLLGYAWTLLAGWNQGRRCGLARGFEYAAALLVLAPAGAALLVCAAAIWGLQALWSLPAVLLAAAAALLPALRALGHRLKQSMMLDAARLAGLSGADAWMAHVLPRLAMLGATWLLRCLPWALAAEAAAGVLGQHPAQLTLGGLLDAAFREGFVKPGTLPLSALPLAALLLALVLGARPLSRLYMPVKP